MNAYIVQRSRLRRGVAAGPAAATLALGENAERFVALGQDAAGIGDAHIAAVARAAAAAADPDRGGDRVGRVAAVVGNDRGAASAAAAADALGKDAVRPGTRRLDLSVIA
ncbi:MAG: hypothetical protein WDN04_18125 [Rhodospirillales bacterium]